MKNIFLLILVIILLVVGGTLYFMSTDPIHQELSINSFEDCAAAGYPIMESYPARCSTPDSRTFVQVIDEAPLEEATSTPPVVNATSSAVLPKPPVTAAKPCFVGGCSSQLCSDQEGMASTCEYRESYACYQNATCERQQDGQCGWTQTSELALCLSK